MRLYATDGLRKAAKDRAPRQRELKPRRIRNPEKFIAPAEAADQLRRLADDIAKRPVGSRVRFYIQFSFATIEELDYSIAKDAERAARRRKNA